MALNDSSTPGDAAATGSRYTVDTKISDLLTDPQAAEVLKAFVQQQRVQAGKPELTAKEQARLIDFVSGMTPRQVANFPQAHMDAASLDRLNTELAEIQAPTQVSASDPPQG